MLDNAMNVFFNGVQIPSFIRVTNIGYSMLPNIDASKDRTLFNERVITIDFIFIMNKMRTLEEINELNSWIMGNNFEPSMLKLPGDDFYYMAKVTNAVEITGNFNGGSGQIKFTCYEPNRLTENKEAVFSISEHTLTYNGNAGNFPIIELTPSVGTSNIKIAVKNSLYDNFIELSGNFPADKLIVINMKTKKITVDKVLRLNFMTLDSSFHKLMNGDNKYKITGMTGSTKIKYIEEYL